MKDNQEKNHQKQRLSKIKSLQNYKNVSQQNQERKKKLQNNKGNKKKLQQNDFSECSVDLKKNQKQEKSKIKKAQLNNGQILEDYKKIKSTQKNMCFLLDKIKDKYIQKQNMLLSIVQATILELRQIQNSISNSLDKTKQQQIDLVQPEIYQFFINSKKIKKIINNNLKQNEINIQNAFLSGSKILDKLQRIQLNLNPLYQQADSFCSKLKQFQIWLKKPLLEQIPYQKKKQACQTQFLQNSFQKIKKIMIQGSTKEKQDVYFQDKEKNILMRKQQENAIQIQKQQEKIIQVQKQQEQTIQIQGKQIERNNNSHINAEIQQNQGLNKTFQYQNKSNIQLILNDQQRDNFNSTIQLKSGKQNQFSQSSQSMHLKNKGIELNQRIIKKINKTQQNQIKQLYFYNHNNQQDFKINCKPTLQQSIINKHKSFNTLKLDKKSISIERLLQNLKTKQFKNLSQSCQRQLKQCRSMDNITKLNFSCFKQFNLNLDNINKKGKNQQELFAYSKTIKQNMSQRSSRSKFNILDILRKQKCKFQAIKNSSFI